MGIINFVLFVLGGLLGILGVYLYYRASIFAKSAIKTVGTITQVERVYLPDTHSHALVPTIEFKAENGKVITFKKNERNNVSKYEVGSNINVIYDRANPKNCKTADFAENFGVSVWCFVVAINLIIFGFVAR